MINKLWFYLYAPFFLLLAGALIVFNLYSSYSYSDFSIQEAKNQLKNEANLFQHSLPKSLSDLNDFQKHCTRLGQVTGTRFTLIKMNGEVIGDSVENYKTMDNHSKRPEILELINDKDESIKIRFSDTLNMKFMYYAKRYGLADGNVIYIRASLPLDYIDDNISAILSKILFGGLVVVIISSIIIYYFTSRIVNQINEFQKGAEDYAKGDFSNKISSHRVIEFNDLAKSMNRMSETLDEKIRTSKEQHNQLNAILSSLTEGVIAINLQDKIISYNNTLSDLLNNQSINIGDSIHEVIANSELVEFISNTLSHEEMQEKQIELLHGTVKTVMVRGRLLKDAFGEKMGAVVVLSDISKLKRLEQVRQDFVANVSHEIKTPITSIKGFVETLQDGALEDKENASKFIDIISKQVNRLITIIEDLLILSQLEKEKGLLEDCHLHNINDLFDIVYTSCADKANLKNIKLEFEKYENLSTYFNFNLIEQALRNLVENAIRYSESDKTISVSCIFTVNEVEFSVKDEGIGIPNEHISRIFERFYRVDKARSRKVGGTGLGLSIVNHIAKAHGGRPSVESKLGFGSTFKIHISRHINQT